MNSMWTPHTLKHTKLTNIRKAFFFFSAYTHYRQIQGICGGVVCLILKVLNS